MSKAIDDADMDARLNATAAATELYLCTGDPADRTAARAASLTDIGTPESPPTNSGPQAGVPDGRQITYNALAGLTITAAGDGDTVVLCTATTLKLKTDLATQLTGLQINDTVDLTSFIDLIRDPA